MARKLYIDTSSGNFVSGVNSSAVVFLDNMFNGDVAPYELYFLTPSSTGVALFDPVDNSSASVKLQIGQAPPSTASAYISQYTWSNLPTTVTATITRIITGSVSTNEQQKITLSPSAFNGTFSVTIPTRAITFASITAGVFTSSGNHGLALREKFIITGTTTPSNFTNGTNFYVAQIDSPSTFYAATSATSSAVTSYSAVGAGSAYTLTATSKTIKALDSVAAAQSALENINSVGSGNVTVDGVPGSEYYVTFQGAKSQTLIPLVTVAGSLTPLYGKSATITFTSTALTNAISASASIDGTIEVQVINGSEVTTVLQQSLSIKKDIIS